MVLTGTDGWTFDDIGHAHDPGYGRNVADEIVVELFVKRCVDSIAQRGQQERVAIGRRAYGNFGPDSGAAARSVLDDELLAKPLREPLPDQSRRYVEPAAGGNRNDDAYRPGRIGLRPREWRANGSTAAPAARWRI